MEGQPRRQIETALSRVLESPYFSLSSRLRSFLEFVVRETLEGRGEALKEYTVALHVYGKSSDFDPRADSVVRVEAVKLRSRLAEYYAGPGAADSIRIAIPKGGYRATFTSVSSSQEPADFNQDREADAKVSWIHTRPFRRLGWIPVVLGVFAAIVAAVRVPEARHRQLDTLPELLPFTTYPGHEFRPALSPDGRYAAFGWNGGADSPDFAIYLRPVSEDKPIRLTASTGWEGGPEWSPDGRSIAFVRANEGVVIFDLVQRSEKKLGNPGAIPCLGWLPDSSAILFPSRETGALMAVPASGGAAKQFASLSAGGQIRCGKISPNGKWLVVQASFSDHESNLLLRDQGGGSWKSLLTKVWDISNFSWLPNSDELVFAGRQKSEYTLLRMSLEGGLPRMIPGVGEGTFWVSSAKDLLLYQTIHRDSNLTLFRPSTHEARPLFRSSRQEWIPTLSPDGVRIAFVSDREGGLDLWVGNTDGSRLRRITNLGGRRVESAVWRPGGNEIAFHSFQNGQADIYVVPAEGGTVRQLTKGNGNKVLPAWSADGQSIYFIADTEGRPAVFKQDFDGGDIERVLSLQAPVKHFEIGKQWMYFQYDANSRKPSPVFRARVSGGRVEQLVPQSLAGLWTVNPTQLFFLDTQDASPKTRFSMLSTLAPGTERVRPVELPVVSVGSFSASGSGDWLAVSSMEKLEIDLMLMRGFR